MESLTAPTLFARLLALRQGLVSDETFFADIAAASVTVMVDARDGGRHNRATQKPMLVNCAEGSPLVALFSSHRIASGGATHFPDYARPVRLRLSRVLKDLPLGCGIVINPGLPDCFELDASDLQTLHRRHWAGILRQSRST